MGAADSRSLRLESYVRMDHEVLCLSTSFPFRQFLGDDMRMELMQHFSVVLHGALGSYLRAGLLEDSTDAVACPPVPRG
jgi:hypothetical protein